MHNEQAIRVAIAEVAALIDGTDVVMFTTRNGEGRMVSRPLAMRTIPFDGNAWFLTALDSRKVGELKADPRVNLAYVNTSKGTYVSIDGRAHVSVDRARIAALCVEADTAEAWTSASTAVGRAFDFVKARLTGDSAALGSQKHFDLHTGLRTTSSR